MTVFKALGQGLKRLWKWANLRFFWQILLAFVLVTLFTAVGIFLVGQRAVDQTQDLFRKHPSHDQELWVDRLGRYYQQNGSWAGADTMIAGYPVGPGWEPWDESWMPSYLLISDSGTVLYSNREDRVGQPASRFEINFAVPITVEGKLVGNLVLSDVPYVLAEFPDPRTDSRPPDLFSPEWLADLFGFPERRGVIVDRMVQTSVYVMLVALIATVLISRGMSRPMSELTRASRTIAGGDLNVRVSSSYTGEIGELAEAFNHMTEALRHADSVRRNMTVDVAHELRTPLSIIRGKLEGILDGVYPATPEHITPVLEQTALLTHLVEDLRLLAEAEADQLRLDLRPTDVEDLLNDAYVNFSCQAEDRGVTLSLDLPSGLPKANADWRRIAQVLGNLISNALRFTPGGGTITLGAAERAGMVEVTISDTGSGIAAEDLPYVFDRFWRGDKSRSRSGGGSGLGLAIARQLVELHGGTIVVESAAGKGTTFRFTLPKAV